MQAFTPTLVLFPSHSGCSRHPWLWENLCPWSTCESHSCISYHYRVPFWYMWVHSLPGSQNSVIQTPDQGTCMCTDY